MFVYILYSKKFDRYYVGQCEDVDVRLLRHNRGGVPSTSRYIPWNVVHKESFETRSQAMLRENEIKKKKSRHYIESLLRNW